MTNEELVKSIKTGANKCEHMLQLWQQNKRFVSMIAQKYIGNAEKDDLEQEGYIALCHAVEGYNEELGIPFINYAAWWLHQGMRRYIENCGSVVRIPVREQQKLIKYKKAVNNFKMRYGWQPTQADIAVFMDITEEQVASIAKCLRMQGVRSLDSPIDDEEGECTVGELVASAENIEADVLNRVEQEKLKEILWNVVDTLPEKQSQVLRMRYQQGKTLNEIGIVLNTSYQAVHELQYKAFREMRKKQRTKRLEPFLADYIGSRPYYCNGIESFTRTLTSSTEDAALRLYEDWIKEG